MTTPTTTIGSESAEMEDLGEAIASLKSSDEVTMFLADLLTPSEQHAITQRFLIAQELFLGKSYADIQRKKQVSATTIARVSLRLNWGNGALKTIVKHHLCPPS